MKTYVLCAILLCAFSLAHADILPNPLLFHHVEGKSTIVNLDKFPQWKVVGYITGPVSQSGIPFLLQQNKPFDHGYKLARLNLYFSSTAYLEKVGLSGITIARLSAYESEIADQNLHLIDPNSYVVAGYENVGNFNPVTGDDYEYSVAINPTTHQPYLYQSKEICRYFGVEFNTVNMIMILVCASLVILWYKRRKKAQHA